MVFFKFLPTILINSVISVPLKLGEYCAAFTVELINRTLNAIAADTAIKKRFNKQKGKAQEHTNG